MSRILATHCDDSKVSIAMDDMAYPHCVWVDGKTVKYARYCGDGWRTAGGTVVVTTSQNDVSVSRHCVGFDSDGNCFFVFLDGDDLVMCQWNGVLWSREVIWAGAEGYGLLAWSVAWTDAPVVLAVTNDQNIWATDKSTGSWGTPESTPIPSSDNETVELKATRVSSWIYAFWTGKDSSSGTTWIGHAAWDVDGQDWVFLPNKRVEMSVDDGEIAGIDFSVWDELELPGIGEAEIEVSLVVT